jgi:chromosome segregation ATPase
MTWLYTWAAGKAAWLAIIGALLACLMFQQVRVSNARAGADRARAELADTKTRYAQAAQKASEDNRKIEAQRQKQAQEAIDESKKREAALRSDAAASRGALERLRNAVRAASGVLPGSASNPIGGPSTAAELLSQCAAEYQSLGERADQHASDVRTLTEAWPKP